MAVAKCCIEKVDIKKRMIETISVTLETKAGNRGEKLDVENSRRTPSLGCTTADFR